MMLEWIVMKALLYLKGRDLKILSVWKIKHENTAWHLIQKEQDEMKEQASLCSLLFF
jgi:hypothetical protein